MFNVCEISNMGNYLQKIREEKGITRPQLAEMVGTNKGQIWKLEKGERRLSDIWLSKLSKALNVSQSSILGETPTTGETRVIGFVQAGLFTESRTLPEEEQESVPTPKNKWGYEHFSGLKVKGDSMDKIFPEGTILLCVDVHDFKDPLETGLFVIVQRRGEGDTWESTVKELVVEENGETFLVPHSTNPRHQAIVIAATDKWTDGDLPQGEAPDLYVSGVVVFDFQTRVKA